MDNRPPPLVLFFAHFCALGPFIFVKLLRLTEQGAVKLAKTKSAVYSHSLNSSPHFHEKLIFPIHSKRHRMDFEVYVRPQFFNVMEGHPRIGDTRSSPCRTNIRP